MKHIGNSHKDYSRRQAGTFLRFLRRTRHQRMIRWLMHCQSAGWLIAGVFATLAAMRLIAGDPAWQVHCLASVVLLSVAIGASLTAKRQNERLLRRLAHQRTVVQTRHRRSQGVVAEHIATLRAVNEQLTEKSTQIELRGREIYKLFQAASEQAQVLARAKDEAEAANRAKSELLANMSHELRTPMTAVLGFSEVLVGDVARAERKEIVSTIRRNGEYLLRLIDDLLDLSRIEAGKLQVAPVPCSPREIVNEVIELLQARACEKSIELRKECEGEIPATIHSDPTRLRQILINLIGNAIKFTEVGFVRVVTRQIGQDADDRQLELRVIDTGVGMSREQISRLFEPFTQADTSSTRQYGGSGLGLAISKHLAMILGGDVAVTSVPGEGSIFTLAVPLSWRGHRISADDHRETCEQTPENSISLEATRLGFPYRILLAEDGPDNQRLISLLLKQAGAKVTTVENGRQCLERAHQAEREGYPYDLILMDMQMPEMDGYVATRRLRDCGYHGPIVALTAHTMKGDKQKCLEAGCDGYLGKPIRRDALLVAVRRWARKTKTVCAQLGTGDCTGMILQDEN